MKQGLSKREKILLFSAGLLLIFYVSIQFVILPLMARYNDALSEKDIKLSHKASVDLDIASKLIIVEQNNEAGKRYIELKNEYPVLVPDEEIDTILTNLCRTNGLIPTSLRMTRPDTSKNTAGANGAEPNLFTIVTASMEMNGTNRALLDLIDEVDSIQYIRIVNMTYSANRSAENNNNDSVKLDFELTFITP